MQCKKVKQDPLLQMEEGMTWNGRTQMMLNGKMLDGEVTNVPTENKDFNGISSYEKGLEKRTQARAEMCQVWEFHCARSM